MKKHLLQTLLMALMMSLGISTAVPKPEQARHAGAGNVHESQPCRERTGGSQFGHRGATKEFAWNRDAYSKKIIAGRPYAKKKTDLVRTRRSFPRPLRQNCRQSDRQAAQGVVQAHQPGRDQCDTSAVSFEQLDF